MKAGDYVICINDSNWDKDVYHVFNLVPVKGHIYRIRRVIPNWGSPDGPDGIALEGVFGDWEIFEHYNGSEIYEEYHFRKDRFQVIEQDQEELLTSLKKLQYIGNHSPAVKLVQQSDDEITQEYLERFHGFSNQELVDAFNQQVRIGTVAVRRQMLYIIALKEVMQERFTTSIILWKNDYNFSLKQRLRLVDDIIYPENFEID